jgi:exopolyphosphatase/guanosine-5'-triphosphate,3'-diphosphate pyrophosphatase
MKKPRVNAVIDLGSNTFHILVVHADNRETIYRERVFVSLAEEGISRIGAAAYARGVQAIQHFADVLSAYDIVQLRAVGTAALRSASNAPAFVEDVYAQTGIQIEVIDGLQEARYIHAGIATTIDISQGQHLIMDIGGGSVEFIAIDDGDLTLTRSYNIGLGELHNRYSHDHPISDDQHRLIKSYAKDHIHEVCASATVQASQQLIGASGSFEVLAALCGVELAFDRAVSIDVSMAREQIKAVFQMTFDQIKAHKAIPTSRAKLIVLAMILIELALDSTDAKTICLSPAAMKEGVLAQL